MLSAESEILGIKKSLISVFQTNISQGNILLKSKHKSSQLLKHVLKIFLVFKAKADINCTKLYITVLSNFEMRVQAGNIHRKEAIVSE